MQVFVSSDLVSLKKKNPHSKQSPLLSVCQKHWFGKVWGEEAVWDTGYQEASPSAEVREKPRSHLSEVSHAPEGLDLISTVPLVTLVLLLPGLASLTR